MLSCLQCLATATALSLARLALVLRCTYEVDHEYREGYIVVVWYSYLADNLQLRCKAQFHEPNPLWYYVCNYVYTVEYFVNAHCTVLDYRVEECVTVIYIYLILSDTMPCQVSVQCTMTHFWLKHFSHPFYGRIPNHTNSMIPWNGNPIPIPYHTTWYHTIPYHTIIPKLSQGVCGPFYIISAGWNTGPLGSIFCGQVLQIFADILSYKWGLYGEFHSLKISSVGLYPRFWLTQCSSQWYGLW